MSKVVDARAWLVDLEVEATRSDAVQNFDKQETLLVEVETADGLTGTGYSYTIGTGGRAVLSMLRQHLLSRLPGHDAQNIEHIWCRLFSEVRATMVGPIASLALAAVDVALWDLKCQRADEPLWRAAGGFRREVPLYDTEGGWLHLSSDELQSNALAARDAGWSGVKVKVGKTHLHEDLERLRTVRAAVGDEMDVMVDANQAWTGAEAIRRARAFEEVGLLWFEEPLPADDVGGHARLAASTSIPVAVGESVYSLAQFRDYLARDAAGVVQVDVARIGGITPWLKVAHLAESFNVVVCPHFLMELHVGLTAAIPNGRYVEHIPQLQAITHGELLVQDGLAVASESPGIGIDWNWDAIDDRIVA